MPFAYDTQVGLNSAVALVNTLESDHDALSDLTGLRAFLAVNTFSGVMRRDDTELRQVRVMRARLRALWDVTDRAEAAARVNEILADTASAPYLSKHDGIDWHLHVTRPDDPLADRIGAEAAMGFLDLIREDAWDRLGTCFADDCISVLVDLSKNRSKRYCGAECGNRANVAAYRARKRAES